jgi:hypothetical protein
LSQDTGNRIRAFDKEFWDVFQEEGVKIPIRGYEMVINTGDHQPIAVGRMGIKRKLKIVDSE